MPFLQTTSPKEPARMPHTLRMFSFFRDDRNYDTCDDMPSLEKDVPPVVYGTPPLEEDSAFGIVTVNKMDSNLEACYETLECDKNAHMREVRAAFLALAKRYHPDKNTTENATAHFQKIHEAYLSIQVYQTRVLGNPAWSFNIAAAFGWLDRKYIDKADFKADCDHRFLTACLREKDIIRIDLLRLTGWSSSVVLYFYQCKAIYDSCLYGVQLLTFERTKDKDLREACGRVILNKNEIHSDCFDVGYSFDFILTDNPLVKHATLNSRPFMEGLLLEDRKVEHFTSREIALLLEHGMQKNSVAMLFERLPNLNDIIKKSPKRAEVLIATTGANTEYDVEQIARLAGLEDADIITFLENLQPDSRVKSASKGI